MFVSREKSILRWLFFDYLFCYGFYQYLQNKCIKWLWYNNVATNSKFFSIL